MSRVQMIISIFLLVMVFLSFHGDISAREDDGPEIGIILEAYDFEVDARNGMEGVVIVNGTMKCILPSGVSKDETCIIDIMVGSDPWPSSDPPNMVFSRDRGIAEFQFSVIPPLWGAGRETQRVELTGTWVLTRENVGGLIDPVFINITPKRFLDVDLRHGITFGKAERGQWVVFSVGIENGEEFDVNVTLSADPESDHLEVEPGSVTVFVPKHETLVQTFMVRNTKSLSERNHITINGTCDEGEPYFTMSMDLYLETRPDPSTLQRNLVIIGSIAGVLLVLLVIFIIVVRVLKLYQDEE